MNERILVIDDDETLSKMLAQRLIAQGFEVLATQNGREGLKVAYSYHPDLVILDIMMPEMDGYETCQRLRELTDVPILMLTAKTTEEDLIRGFQQGADDYVKKPFSFRELDARISAILKRASVQDEEPSVFDDGKLKIDLERQHVYVNGGMVHLTPTEFRLLSFLVRNKDSVKRHDIILKDVWGEAYADATACLSLYIRYLREKLEDDPSNPNYILTKWGRGYWFSSSGQDNLEND